MAFTKTLAKAGMFGLAGQLIAGNKDKKEKPKPSLVTGDYATNTGSNTLVNQKSIY
jgi:hypothetical protein